MKNLSLLIAILVITLLSACSSTATVAVEKKALISDHYLMMGLLHRPMTQDQKMMLAFAEQQESYQTSYFVNAVSIKGPKNDFKCRGLTSCRQHHRNQLIPLSIVDKYKA